MFQTISPKFNNSISSYRTNPETLPLQLHSSYQVHDSIHFKGEDKNLRSAAEKGDLEAAKTALKNGANVNAASFFDGMQAIHYAASKGREEIIKLLLQHGANVNAKAGNSGYEPSHFAAETGNLNILKLLLDNGANLYGKGEDGAQLLHCAAFCNPPNSEMIKYLIDIGADLDAKDCNNELPDEYTKSKDIKELLRSSRKERSQQLLKAKNTLNEKDQQITSDNLERQRLNSELSATQSELEALQSIKSALELENSTLKEKLDAEKKATQKQIELKRQRSQELQGQAAEQMTVAQSKFESEKKKLTGQLNDERGRLRTIEQERNRYHRDATTLTQEKQALQSKLSARDTEIRNRSLDRQERSKERVALQTEVRNLEQDIKAEQRRIKIEKTLNRDQNEDLYKYKTRIAILEERLEEANKRLREARQKGLVSDWVEEVARSQADDAEMKSTHAQFDPNLINTEEELQRRVAIESEQEASGGYKALSENQTGKLPDNSSTKSYEQTSSDFRRGLKKLEREESTEGSTGKRSRVQINAETQSQSASEAPSAASSFGRRSKWKVGFDKLSNKARSIFNPEESSSEEGSLASNANSDKHFKRTARRRTVEDRLNPSSKLKDGISHLSFDTDSLDGTESVGEPERSVSALQKSYQQDRINGQHPLLDAFVNKDFQTVETILKRDPKAIWQENAAGENIFHWAALLGADNYIKKFLDLPSINAFELANKKTQNGLNALMLAAAQGHTKVGEVLLTHPKANLDVTTTQGSEIFGNGQNALHIAIQNKKPDFARLILAHTPKNKSALVNAQNVHGQTPGMNAAQNGYPQLIAEMLKWPDLNTLVRDHSERDMASHAADYGIKTAQAGKGKDGKGEWQSLNQLVLAKEKGARIVFDAHSPDEEMSVFSKTAGHGTATVLGRMQSFSGFNPNQSVFRKNPTAAHTFTTPLLTAAEYGNIDGLNVLLADSRVQQKRRIKAYRSGDDALKVAVKYDQEASVRRLLADEYSRGIMKPYKILKRNRKKLNAVQIGFRHGSLAALSSIQEARPEMKIEYTDSDLKAAQKNVPTHKYAAFTKVLEKARRV